VSGTKATSPFSCQVDDFFLIFKTLKQIYKASSFGKAVHNFEGLSLESGKESRGEVDAREY
jgi:hypothetical protein